MPLTVTPDTSTLFDDVSLDDLPDPDLTENARIVLNKRYLIKDEEGNPAETPKDMFWRVARTIAAEDKKYGASDEEVRELAKGFYYMMSQGYWLPNSPTLFNAGRKLGLLSACVVLPVEDTLSDGERGIYDTLTNMALCHQAGAGTGFSFSKIRPRGSIVKSTTGVASGPVSFMSLYDASTEVVKQGGCFTGDTLIATAEGARPIRELEDGDLVYAYDREEGFILTPCTGSWQTKTDTEVVEVETDKGLVFRATPDHPVMRRVPGRDPRKSYKRVEDLEIGDPLMPLTRYKKTSGRGDEWFISLHDGSGGQVPEHRWMAEQAGYDIEDMAVHHKDGDHTNNILSNLEVMEGRAHVAYHMKESYENGDHPFHSLTAAQARKRVEGYKESWSSLPEEEQFRLQSERAQAFNQTRLENGTHNFKTDPPMRNEESLQKKLKAAIATSIWKVMQAGHEPQKNNWSEVKGQADLYNTEQYTTGKIEEVFGSFDAALEHASENNHRVVRVEPAGRADVWNVEVPGPHNYVVCDEDRRGVVVANTRRGANMGVLRVDHPDVRDFIHCKQDTSKITNFNISVAVTDEFMEAVKNEDKFDLVDPRDGSVVDTVDARGLMDEIVENAHATGEPGILFMDEANRHNPVPHLGPYRQTNPCLVGSTRLATDRGILTMEELERETMEIRVATDDRVPALRSLVGRPVPSGVEYQNDPGVEQKGGYGVTLRHADPVRRTREDVEVFRLVTEHGYEVTATPDHEFYTPHGPVALEDLAPGDSILLQSGEGAWSADRSLPTFEPTNKFAARVGRGEVELPREWSQELGQVLGWMVGDGWVSEVVPKTEGYDRSTPNYTVGLIFGDNERELEPEFRRRIQRWTGIRGNRTERKGRVQLIFSSSCYYFMESLGLVTQDGKSGRVPDALWKAPRDAVVGFLQALFTADGAVCVSGHKKWSSCSVRLASSDRKLLREVQILLANLGIVSKIYLRRQASEKPMPDGHGGEKVYAYRDQYELILDKTNRDRFAREIGFLTRAKQEKVEAYIDQKGKASDQERFITTVESIEPAGRADVYCTTEPDTHSIVVNGLTTANCGEQFLISDTGGDSCNLGSLNLSKFVSDDGQILWDAMRDRIHLSMQFLDNVIDANDYPIWELEETGRRIRRVGNGVMGWADMLTKLDIGYNSEGATSLARKVGRFFLGECVAASQRLAEQRGVFPEWEHSAWGPDDTCARAEDGSRIRPHCRVRHCDMNTVAPTGTISILAGCSGGIEPLYAVAFMRNQAGTQMVDVNDQFLRRAKDEGWHSNELMEEVANSGSVQNVDGVPEDIKETFTTAHDIAPEDHVRMQAAWQENIHNSLSKCVAKGTLIETDRGPIPIEDFSDNREPGTFVDVKNEITINDNKVISHYCAGMQDGLRLRFDNGYSCVVAKDSHKLKTIDGWKLSKDLCVGDLVIGEFLEGHGGGGMSVNWEDEFNTSANAYVTPKKMSSDLAMWLGMLAADGTLTQTTGIVGISIGGDADPNVEKTFVALYERLFNVTPNRKVDSRNGVVTVYVHSRNLLRYVQSLIGNNAYEKFVPKQILQGSRKEKIAFINGITLDGYVLGRGGEGLCVYGGMSKDLAEGCAAIIRSFGLPKVRTGKKYVRESDAYCYYCTVANEAAGLFNALEPHKNQETTNSKYKVFIDPHSIPLDPNHDSFNKYSTVKRLQRNDKKHCYNTTARDVIGIEPNIPVFRVKEIDAVGRVEMFDIEVEDSHQYVAGGVVHHNTINFPEHATVEDVKNAYLLAHDLNCKGITVYRDGSRPGQVLSTGKTDADNEAAREDGRIKRPEVLHGETRHIDSPTGSMYITINETDDGEPFEVFANLGKAGGSANAHTEAIGRCISVGLQYSVPLQEYAGQLRGITSERMMGFGDGRIRSGPDAIGQVLYRYLSGHNGCTTELDKSAVAACPDCGSSLVISEGCSKCVSCGYSQC